MKQAYATLLLAMLCSGAARAQAYSELGANALRARFYANGFIGSGPAATQGAIRVPAASNAPLLSAGGLWMGGVDNTGQLRFAGHLFDTANERDYFPGPLTTDGTASISPSVSAQYDRVWQITAQQVQDHRAWMDCLQDPGCDIDALFPGGYAIPEPFLSWPAMGNADEGQAPFLAPFVDYDGDLIYDPNNGDHPCILGDEALFLIANDKLEAHTQSGALPIGVEVHTMPFAYTNTPALANTVFIHYKIINRGTLAIPGFRVGQYADFELGCPDDDIIGTDVGRSLLYVANGDDDDQGCLGVPGFGEQPPAFGMVVLKGARLDPDGLDNAQTMAEQYVNGTGYADGITDNERFGLSSSMYWMRSGPTALRDPAVGTAPHFYNYLHGIWRDGMLLTHGGTGYSTAPSAVPTTFTFPGSTDPLGYGTGGVPQAPWSATLDGTGVLIDPRAVGGMGSFTLEPGMHMNLLVAFVHARALSGGALASVAALQQRVDSVRAFALGLPGVWDRPEIAWPGCDFGTTGIGERRMDPLAVRLFPNPAQDEVTVSLGEPNADARITLLDGTGRVVLAQRASGAISHVRLAGMAPGVYAVRVESGQRSGTARLLVH